MKCDNLGSYPEETGGSSLSLPSFVGDHHGRMMMHMHHFYRGTGAVMPSGAVTLKAEKSQKKRGELPQQLSGALWGNSASAQAGRARTEHQRLCCAGHSLAWLTWSSRPQPLFFRRPWQLILCSSCAAAGTHRQCSYLSNTTTTWECDSCAGLGTGKRQSAAWHCAETRQVLAASGWGSVASLSAPGEIAACPSSRLHTADLPSSPYSLQGQLVACQPQHCQPGGPGAIPQPPGM